MILAKFEKARPHVLRPRTVRARIETPAQHEQSPWRAHREYEDRAVREVSDRLLGMFLQIRKRWLGLGGEFRKAAGDELFRIGGRIFISPKTGKPLTVKQWQEVLKSLDAGFRSLFRDQPDVLVKRAMLLGKVLQGMTYESRKAAGVDDVGVPSSIPDDPSWEYAEAFGKQNAASLLVGLQADAKKSVSTAIVDAIKNRRSTRELELELFDRFAELNRDWRRIAETEIANNLTSGMLMAENDTRQEGEVVYMIGISAAGACKACMDHVNGKVVVLLPEPGSGTIRIKGEEYETIWPGKSNVGRRASNYWACVPLHPHCLTEGSLITSARGISSASKRWYDGEVVTIETAGKRKLTVTPNHPILTRFGFVPAAALDVGDQVICYGDGQGEPVFVNDDDVQVPTRVEDVVSAFFKTSGVTTVEVPVSSPDFHGDGSGSEVAVVGTNRLLGRKRKSSFPQHLLQNNFILRYIRRILFHGSRVLRLFFQGHRNASAGSVCVLDLVKSLFSGHQRPLQGLGLSLTSDGHVTGRQDASDDGSAYAEVLGHGVFGHAGQVEADNRPLARRENLLHEVPPMVSEASVLERVVAVHRSPYHGYVYNLETERGYYFAEGIASHNCRCSWTRFYPEMRELLGIGKSKKILSSELLKAMTHKYIKREGVKGHYRYWYRNPQTGKVYEGTAPETQEGKNKNIDDDGILDKILSDSTYNSEEKREGGDWGGAYSDNKYAIAFAYLNSSHYYPTDYLAKGRMNDFSYKLTEDDEYWIKQAIELRNYAQEKMNKISKDSHPFVYRGIGLPKKDFEKIITMKIMTLTGCSAFSFDEIFAKEFEGKYVEEKKEDHVNILLKLKRNEKFDRSVGMCHEDENEENLPLEILSGVSAIKIVGVKKNIDNSYELTIEAVEDINE